VTETSTNCRLGIVIAGTPAGFGVLNARILRLPSPVVNDYAFPFGAFGAGKTCHEIPRRTISQTTCTNP
jgi:hypothetical protein